MSASAALCDNDFGIQYGFLYLRSQNAVVEWNTHKVQNNTARKHILQADQILLEEFCERSTLIFSTFDFL